MGVNSGGRGRQEWPRSPRGERIRERLGGGTFLSLPTRPALTPPASGPFVPAIRPLIVTAPGATNGTNAGRTRRARYETWIDERIPA